MKFSNPLYYCIECKKVVSSLDNLLFVEENTTKGFCSELCIEDFYNPITFHFEDMEKRLRKNLSLEYELIKNHSDDKQLIEEIISLPSEIWTNKNDLDEVLTTFIRHYDTFSALVVCFVYKKEVSFVFLLTKTQSQEFLNEFRIKKSNIDSVDGDRVGDGEKFNEEDFIFMQLLENKKSKLLAELLIKRKESDISFEDFSKYEFCFEDCLESPDEVFETKDNEGDVFFVYIKSFSESKTNFFYIISCLRRSKNDQTEEINVFPVLAFPTNDLAIYSEFSSGLRVAGPLRN